MVGAVLLVSQMAWGQSKSYRMYDEFANKSGVTNFIFSKNMLDVIDLDLSNDGEEKQVTGDLHEIRFMSYNPEKRQLSGPGFTKQAIGFLPKSAYKKYEGDDDDDAEIWLLGGKKKFQECHLFVNNEKDDQIRFVVSFYGDFTVDDLGGLKKSGKGFSDGN